MNVNLMVRGNVLNGFLNIDMAAQPNESDRVLGDPYKLDTLLDANEVEKMVCNDVLDYLPLQGRNQALSHWLTRIAHGGTLVITGNDPYEVSRLVHNGQMDLAQANAIIYGIGRKSFLRPLDNVGVAMNTQQFDLDEVKYSQSKPYEYIVVLRRK